MFGKNYSQSGYKDQDWLVGLDLGTSKITVVVAERDIHSGDAQIIGIGQAPSHGIRKGLIAHLDQAARAVEQAVDDVEMMVGDKIKEVTVAFSSGDVESIRTTAMITLGRSPRAVKQLDIARVIESAQALVNVPESKMILHTIPVEYSLDGNRGIDDPIGMNGTKLDIDLESVVVPKATVQNVKSCVENAGLKVNGYVIKPLASALGALTPEEASVGSVAVDIGGGTCGVAVFHDGRPKHIAVIPVGGEHVTNDVANCLKIPINPAENIKKDVDLCVTDTSALTEDLEFDYNGRKYAYSMSLLTDIVQSRIEELFDVYVRKEIASSGVGTLPGGIVLTGGGSRSIGIDMYLQHVMDMPVRTAIPIDSNRMPPGRNTAEFTCASGIIKYAIEREREPMRYMDQAPETTKPYGRSPGPSQPSPKPHDNDKEYAPAKKDGILGTIKGVLKELF